MPPEVIKRGASVAKKIWELLVRKCLNQLKTGEDRVKAFSELDLPGKWSARNTMQSLTGIVR